MTSVSGPISYGTETMAIYQVDEDRNTNKATFILNNVEYKDMPADFVYSLILAAAKYNL